MTITPLGSDQGLADSIIAGMTGLAQKAIAALSGPLAAQPILGALTWADVATALCFALLTLAVNAVAAGAARRQTHLPAGEAGGVGAQARVVRALSKPLYVLIWVYGGYLALSPLLPALLPSEAQAAARDVGQLLLDAGAFAALVWLFFRGTRELDAHLVRYAERSANQLDDLLLPLVGRSLRIMLPALGVIFALPMLGLPAQYAAVVAKGSSVLLIGAVTLVLFQAVRALERVLLLRFDINVRNNLRARTVYTQVHVITKIVDALIGLFAASSILMLFPEVRHLGTTLLASAGIVGIVAGIAAQKTLANLLAGLQLAFTQPVRQDDVVIVEGEWGRIEEITLTYIVVHIWDDRRLILPLSYFIERPFQNWTRHSAQLLGSVFFAVDYGFPVEKGRQALRAIIEASPRWDRRFWNLQVTDCDDRTMQLRVLATAADSSAAWDLRCEIREKFIAYLQCHHPQSLPRLRAQLASGLTLQDLTPGGASAPERC